MSMPNFFVGLDVHKDTITIAVFRNRDPAAIRVDRVPDDHERLRRYFQPTLTEWGVECELAAPVRFESHVGSCPISGSCPVSPTTLGSVRTASTRSCTISPPRSQDKRLRNFAHCHVNCTERVVATKVLALYGE